MSQGKKSLNLRNKGLTNHDAFSFRHGSISKRLASNVAMGIMNTCLNEKMSHSIQTRWFFPKSVPSNYLNTRHTPDIDDVEKKKGDISKASVWHGVNFDATSHTSHPPTVLPTRELCWVKSVQAAHDIHLFIPGNIHQPLKHQTSGTSMSEHYDVPSGDFKRIFKIKTFWMLLSWPCFVYCGLTFIFTFTLWCLL